MTNSNCTINTIGLILTLILIATSILIKSYFTTDGYLSPDSTAYLELSQNLVNGKGLYISGDGTTSQDLTYFSIWPAGYPLLIAVFSKLTGISVFWASKIVNIVLVSGILLMFLSLFGKFAYAYGFIILFGSYIDIYSYTWSEAPFIFALVFFAAATSKLMLNQSSKNIGFLSPLFGIWLASLMLFLFRYIGVFSVGIIGILSLYFIFIKRNIKIGLSLISVSMLNSMIIFLYLCNNFYKTGYITGMPRIPSPETHFELASALLKSLVLRGLLWSRF